MYGDFRDYLKRELDQIRAEGLLKSERRIRTAQQATIATAERGELLNFCANNYLGLANHPEIVAAARDALHGWGYGMASVRFICGTQELHKELEGALSHFLGTEDTILYSSCFDANGGLFETLLGPDDAVISDELNHASIIDGVRLSKAKRFRYPNRNMAELEAKLLEADRQGARFKMIATDGIFSMDGYLAPLDEICGLADRYGALVMVDDSHATGFIGPSGRGTPEHFGVGDRVDIITSTLGKALGGASGGFTSGRKEIVELLRQRSRPYLFSNTLAPTIVAASLRVLRLLDEKPELRERLRENTRYFREGMLAKDFDILPGEHPIVPVMFYQAEPAVAFAEALLERGIYVIAFSYPVVPRGRARIRAQVSAAHSEEDLDRAMAAFTAVREKLITR